MLSALWETGRWFPRKLNTHLPSSIRPTAEYLGRRNREGRPQTRAQECSHQHHSQEPKPGNNTDVCRREKELANCGMSAW